jgi:hypothetical protein
MNTTNYEQQGIDFLSKTGTTMTVKFNRQGKYFDDDKNERDIYDITLKRGTRSYTFTFGQSLNCSGRFIKNGKPENGIKQVYQFDIYHEWAKNKNFKVPTAYDVLACLQKSDVGTFEDFCNEFGYDTDSRKAGKTYQAVLSEYTQLKTLFTDTELQDMQEIA